jgi:tyrosyl-tRNA synthetase
VPVLILKRFQEAGHKPIALVGGATGMIGDPSFKATERKLNTPDVIAGWVDKIRGQVEPFLSFEGDNAAMMANNYDWFGGMNCLEFLRDIGKHFSVNAMIKKESVQQRLVREDQGISYTEFSYSLLQGYDFAELNKRHGCKLQIGGSDQWGNIVAGTDLTRRLHQAQVYGLTVPLITKADGTKFGKTEVRRRLARPEEDLALRLLPVLAEHLDADVYKFLKFFTFLPLARIERNRSHRQGQRHQAGSPAHPGRGSHPPGARRSRPDGRPPHHRSLFSGQLADLTENDLEQLAQDGMPGVQVDAANGSLIDALVAAGLAKSKSEARTFIQGGSVTPTGGSSGEFWTMGATLIQPCRVSEEGLRVVKLFQPGRKCMG